jgi:DNA-binding NtrC family response regulator
LVIDPQGCIGSQLCDASAGCNEFHCVASVADAKLLLRSQPCPVGLVVFNSSSPLRRQEVEPLVASSEPIEWIAVVAPEVLECKDYQAFILGAFHDYHSLPLDPDRLAMTIGHALGKASLRRSLNGKQHDETGCFGISGNSPVMRALFLQLEKIINADLAVLIGGETGTGKELVAQAIHRHSQRAKGPFVAVNCGAVPDNLIQSELFGHEKGAFTGAGQRKIGSIEAAQGGVLFLDEIGDLPMNLQVNLLRVLQERTITRLGSTQAIPVDFRIIAATHIDLQEAIRAGRFREDLYYRLNVIHLNLPPLRERGDDVILLAEAVFKALANDNKQCRSSGFSSDALQAMRTYDWPGNVRELKNRVHRALILSDNKLISAVDLGLAVLDDKSQAATLEDARATLDRSIVENSLRANANNVSRTARQLGVSRVTLYRMMSKHHIALSPSH